MQPWAIAAIVVMVITFLAVLGLYAFLYLRFTRRVDGRVASATLLHYWDFYRSLQRVTIPPVPQAFTAEQLLTAIAHDVGSIYKGIDIDERTIALARFDKLAQTYVAVDLEVLLGPEHRGLFARQSAFHPLVLLHHHVQDGQARGGTFGFDDDTMQSHPPKSLGGVASPHAPPPPPAIYPTAPLISSETEVTIDVDQFRFDRGHDPVPLLVLKMIKEALQQQSRSLMIAVDGGTTLLVDPERRSADGTPLIMIAVGGEPPRRVIRSAPLRIRYNTGDGSDWEEYQGPFRLAPGRWCVRAEACHLNGTPLSSSSRVYTVEAGFTGV